MCDAQVSLHSKHAWLANMECRCANAQIETAGDGASESKNHFRPSHMLRYLNKPFVEQLVNAVLKVWQQLTSMHRERRTASAAVACSDDPFLPCLPVELELEVASMQVCSMQATSLCITNDL